MAGQQNYRKLTQEAYLDSAQEYLIRSADLYYLDKKFGMGENLDKDKIRHSQLFYNILCTEECEIVDWVSKKINGELGLGSRRLKMKDFKSYGLPYTNGDQVAECCDWAALEW